MPFRRDDVAHDREQLVREERVESAVVDSHRRTLQDLDLDEPRPLELLDEVTLRQGAGDSAGPGRRVGEDFRRELLFVHCEVRDAELPPRPQDPAAFRERPRLSW